MILHEKDVYKTIFLKGLASISLGSLLTTSFGYTYAKYIEPRRLQIVRHTITSKNIPKSFNGIKILQFSDIHLGLSYDLLQLEQLMVTINNLKPSIILFTGDLMDVPNEYPHPERIPRFYRGFRLLLENMPYMVTMIMEDMEQISINKPLKTQDLDF